VAADGNSGIGRRESYTEIGGTDRREVLATGASQHEQQKAYVSSHSLKPVIGQMRQLTL
jgi:hypothetical protein